jgi:hypothetical protein
VVSFTSVREVAAPPEVAFDLLSDHRHSEPAPLRTFAAAGSAGAGRRAAAGG